ncbi:MAG: hypothetical protein KDE31_37690 [Caldilineaceae bacterium]|nr:hypothetical protein [Caldilineaceae bacterium]
MEQQQTQVSSNRVEQKPLTDELQPWQQPKLERLHVSLDTANSFGSSPDGGASTGIN